jgi:hypothetical protein
MIPNADFKSTEEIRRQGIETLAAALGPVNAVRNLSDLRPGKGRLH